MINAWMPNSQILNLLKAEEPAPSDVMAILDTNEERLADLDYSLVEPIETESATELSLSIIYPADGLNAEQIKERNFVLYADMDGHWQQYEIVRVESITSASGDMIEAHCDHVYYELATEPLQTHAFESVTAEHAANAILSGTRWRLGRVIVSGVRTFTLTRSNPLSSLRALETVYECELNFRVSVKENSITDWIVDILPRRGKDTGLYFEFGHNIEDFSVTIDTTNQATALYGYGQAEDIDPDTGGLDPLTFKDISWSIALGDPADKPAGQEWVGDEGARVLYGKPPKPGEVDRRHLFGTYQSEARSPGTLLMETWLQVQKRKKPGVNVQGTYADLEQIAKFSHEKVRYGDTVRVRVKNIEAEVRIIRLIRRRKSPERTRIEMGEYKIRQSDVLQNVAKAAQSTATKQGVYDRAGLFQKVEEGGVTKYFLDGILIGQDAIFSGTIQVGENVVINPNGILQSWGNSNAENLDENHKLALDLYIPENTVSVRSVKLSFKLEQFRAYSKGAASGGGATSGASSANTTASGGSSTPTSGASSASTTASGGSSAPTSGASSTSTTASGGSTSVSSAEETVAGDPGGLCHPAMVVAFCHLPHRHTVSIGSHQHGMNHTHDVSIPNHTHGMGHTHSVSVPAHAHGIEHSHSVPNHTHDIEYGIFLGTTPENVKVFVNGIERLGTYNTGQENLDLSAWITAPGWHTIELSSTRLGRISANYFVELFIGL